jgi:D-aminoacyl-tRNA deacylase
LKMVIQRVSSAYVNVEGKTVGEIGQGLLILLGIGKQDTKAEIEWGVRKVISLRIFQDDQEKMNRSLTDVNGSALVISQFTLYGEANKGCRPSFIDAALPEHAIPLYEHFIASLIEQGVPTASGIFGAKMSVYLVNEGPVTIIIDK